MLSMEGEMKKLTSESFNPTEVPTIDFNDLISNNNSQTRSLMVQNIRQACQEMGFFQVINHGISRSAIEDAFVSSAKFFDLPNDDEEKKKLISNDVKKPVRFESIGSNNNNDNNNNNNDRRDFIKLYAHPLQDWILSWPNYPADFREKIGNYATEMRKISIKIVEAIMESLGLSPNYLRDKIEQGIQLIVINRYAQYYGFPSSSSSTSINRLGIAPHTDHTIITILLENTSGLEILDHHHSNAWKVVPAAMKCALTVLVGNHLEVLSNGIYKSVFHRVGLSPQNGRISIGSFHSLAMGDMVEPALELIDQDNNPKSYRASSLEEYLKYISSKQPKPYIESLKI